MDDATPKDFSRSPVEQFARFLMVSAKEDPSLLRRAPASPSDIFLDRVRELPAMLYPPAQRIQVPQGSHQGSHQGSPQGNHQGGQVSDPYLEDLVALAIASAREAEDASREANTAIARARRGTYVFASVAALGLTVGVVGILNARPENRGVPMPAINGAAIGGTQESAAAPDVRINSRQFAMLRIPPVHSPFEDWGPGITSLSPEGQAASPDVHAKDGADAQLVRVASGTEDASGAPTASQPPGTTLNSSPPAADNGNPAPKYAVQRPAAHRPYRQVRYAYAFARPPYQVTRFLSEIQWRINSVFR